MVPPSQNNESSFTGESYEQLISEIGELVQKYEMETNREQRSVGEKSVAATVFTLIDDYETDMFIGVREDNNYIDIRWHFDLLPFLGNIISDDLATELIEAAQQEYDLSEYPNDMVQQITALHNSDDLESNVSESELEDLVADSEQSVEETLNSLYRQLYAARVALGEINERKMQELSLELKRLFINNPVRTTIGRTGGALHSFRITHRLYPNEEDGFTRQGFDEALQVVVNLGSYSEQFLKFTFNVEESEEIEIRPSIGDKKPEKSTSGRSEFGSDPAT